MSCWIKQDRLPENLLKVMLENGKVCGIYERLIENCMNVDLTLNMEILMFEMRFMFSWSYGLV